MNKFFVGLAVLLLAVGCSQKPVARVEQKPLSATEAVLPSQIQPNVSDMPTPWIQADSAGHFQSHKEGGAQVLYRIIDPATGASTKTNFSIPYTWDTSAYPVDMVLTVSPSEQLVAYNVWDTSRKTMLIFVADIDGGNKKQVAQQQVPEGHGQLNPYTLAFTPDSAFLVFREVSDTDTGPASTVYMVDLATTTTSKLAGSSEVGYIKSFSLATKSRPAKIVYGHTQFLGGDEAGQVAGTDLGCKPSSDPVGICLADGTASPPNGFWIHDLKKTSTYTLSENVVIELIPLTGGVEIRPAVVEDLQKLLKQDADNRKATPSYLGTPFTALVQGGEVVVLTQMYVP